MSYSWMKFGLLSLCILLAAGATAVGETAPMPMNAALS